MQRAPHKAMLCLCAPLRQCSFVACRLFSCDHVPLCRQVDFHVIRPQVFVWSAWHLEFHDSLTNESDLKKSGGWGAHQPMREFWKNNISVEVKLLSESKVYGALLPRRLFLERGRRHSFLGSMLAATRAQSTTGHMASSLYYRW